MISSASGLGAEMLDLSRSGEDGEFGESRTPFSGFIVWLLGLEGLVSEG